MEYLSRDNAVKTLKSMDEAFGKIFDRIGEGRIDRDMRDLGSFEKFQIKGMKFGDFAKIANRVRCRFVPLVEDEKAKRIKEGDWVFDKEFFSIKFSIEEVYFLHKTVFNKVGEQGREIKIRKYIEVKGGRRGYGIKDWDKEKVLELIKGNKDSKTCEIVKGKLDSADDEIKKWAEISNDKGTEK